MFRDRQDAGQQLAEKLQSFRDEHCIIYGLPRGGIPVAYEVSMSLRKTLEALIVKKIGAPGQEELALGAVCEGEPPTLYFNSELMEYLGLERRHIQPIIDRKLAEIAEIKHMYRGAGQLKLETSATAIVVDDGIATGATMKAAVSFLKGVGQKRIVVAVPVAQESVLQEIEAIAGEIVCVRGVKSMYAVGEFYEDFSQVTHDAVVKMLLMAEDQLRH